MNEIQRQICSVSYYYDNILDLQTIFPFEGVWLERNFII